MTSLYTGPDRGDAVSETMTLDEAWAAVQAALPEGWSPTGVADDSTAPMRGVRWKARAAAPYLVVAAGSFDEVIEIAKDRATGKDVDFALVQEHGDGTAAYESRHVEAKGTTPAAALQALAAALRDSPDHP